MKSRRSRRPWKRRKPWKSRKPHGHEGDPLGETADRLGKFDGGWAFVIVGQLVLAILALTTDKGTPTAAKAQGALLLISTVAILLSLLLVPRVGLARVFHAAPMVSLFLGVASLMFVIDFSLIARHGPVIGGASAVAALFALRNIAAVWRERLGR